MAFELGSDQVAAILASLHCTADDKRAALRAKLRHFQRLGFPEGVNVGKGKAAKYGAGELITLTLALEFAQLGLTPERIVHLIRRDYFPIFATVKRSIDAMMTGGWSFKRDGAGKSIFLYFEPAILAHLSQPDSDSTDKSFAWSGALHLTKHLAHSTSSFEHRRLSLLNVTATLDALILFMPADQRNALLDEGERWARIGTLGWPDRSIVGPWETE